MKYGMKTITTIIAGVLDLNTHRTLDHGPWLESRPVQRNSRAMIQFKQIIYFLSTILFDVFLCEYFFMPSMQSVKMVQYSTVQTN